MSADPAVSRQEWQKVIQSLLVLHRSGKGPTANKALFLAGKACLRLYQRSGMVEDLDQAITCLGNFVKINRQGPDLVPALKHLKSAHLLKRGVEKISGEKASRLKIKSFAAAKAGDAAGWTQKKSISESRPTSPVSAATTKTIDIPGQSGQTASSNFCNTAGNPYFARPAGSSGMRSPAMPSRSPGLRLPKVKEISPAPSSASLPALREQSVPEDIPRKTIEAESSDSGKIQKQVNSNAAGGGELSGTSGAPPRDAPTRGPAAPAAIASLAPSNAINLPSSNRTGPIVPRPYFVVIDPGHGGKDPGAVSKDGKTKEKDLTLEIARKVKERLTKKMPEVMVQLTRSEDKFLSLQERTAIANSLNADLFLSIHCNGADDSISKGVETFFLSKSGSRAAMRVAARENGIPLSKMSDLEATLIDLMVAAKKAESDRLANSVHKLLIQSLRQSYPSRDRGVKGAPFYVLLGAKMPAALIECAFISSRKEREKLTSKGYLDAISRGIAEGAKKYLEGLGNRGDA